MASLAAALTATAADKYSSGSITWDTVSTEWSTAPGGPYTGLWTDDDDAYLEGSAGTVVLGEDINVSNLTISVNSYDIEGGYTLDFAAGAIITNTGNGVIISAGVTGSPDVYPDQGGNQDLTFAPTNDPVTLGTVYRVADNYIIFDGTTTGNSVSDVPKNNANAKVHFNEFGGTSEWTVNDVYGGYVNIYGGDVIVEGELTADTWRIQLYDGVLHYNNAGAVKGPTSGSSASEKFRIHGGSMDNSSGSAISTSTWDPAQGWYGDWTFIGSLGASSDLNLGTGAVTMSLSSPVKSNIVVTVSNSLTTLTIGGAIGDGGDTHGLVKSGAGTMVLSYTNTYSGDTVVEDGMLDVRAASSLTNCIAIQIDANGTLRLEHADNGGSPWNFAALSALNSNLRSGLDTGTAGNLTFSENVAGYTDVTATPPNPHSTAYWDGNDSTGDADGGAGTWDNSSSNWDDAETGGASIAWDANSSSNDTAIFGGSAGTVDLGADIDLRRIQINTASYQIGANGETYDLNFRSLSPRITVNNVAGVRIKAGITGSPELAYSRGNNQHLYLEPEGASMTLGAIRRLTDDYLHLGGTTTGNSATEMTAVDTRAKVYKDGSGTWTIGDMTTGDLQIDAGVLKLTGTLFGGNWGFYLDSGGTLHYNNGDVMGVNNKFRFRGGAFDNTSGSAITGSTLNNGYYLEADTTFIGSLGANSDLNLGTGAATLNITAALDTEVKLTVSNAAATLTIGGAVGDGGNDYGVSKAGAGTLILMTANTYTGDTIVEDGMLDVRDAASLSNCSAIQIDADGTLRLEHADNGGSAWDFTALSTLNANLRSGLDTGTAGNIVFSENVAGYTDVTATPPNPHVSAYWDGNDSTGDADGGAGTWDNSASNWDDAETGGASIAWDSNSTSNDTAIFGGTGGEVGIDADIALRRLEVYSTSYQIGSDTETHVLNFGSLNPRLSVFEHNCTVKAGITGSPEVVFDRGGNQRFYLYPATAPMTLGWIRRLSDDYLHLGGTNTGNTALGMSVVNNRTKLLKDGSGTWTIAGDVYAGAITLNGGRLVLNGEVRGRTTSALSFSGGTLAGTGVLTNLNVNVPVGQYHRAGRHDRHDDDYESELHHIWHACN